MEPNISSTLTTELLQLITVEQAWYYCIVPKLNNDTKIIFYIDIEHNTPLVCNELEMVFGKMVELISVQTDIIHSILGKHYRRSQKHIIGKQLVALNGDSGDFLEKLVTEANSIGSSDIHIESYENKCRIRLRIDGKLVEKYILKKDDYPALINKIKIKSNLDIAEKRLSQDGRIYFISSMEKFDIRVSVLPTLYGEKIVLRLLSKDATTIDIAQLGFNQTQLAQYIEAIKKPNGIVLISGPTGSGKTTTLYATLRILNKESTNILTIEDPIEYTLDGINQVQLKESIGLTFASTLRTFLRQDPDIIMLGEIRDGETAQMAIRAALTGHLVLSTIHTNSAWGTITRLMDMGIPSFLIASTINLTAAQRLVRLLCPHCKESAEFKEEFLPANYEKPKSLSFHYIAIGCDKCYYTGYHGRKAIYEIIPIDNDISGHIRRGITEFGVDMNDKGFTSLSSAAFSLLEQGDTSIEEVYSILMNTN